MHDIMYEVTVTKFYVLFNFVVFLIVQCHTCTEIVNIFNAYNRIYAS